MTPPILRLSAIIYDLRKQGHNIVDLNANRPIAKGRYSKYALR